MANRRYKRADSKNPYMGLDNTVCSTPAYWCRLHQIWLSGGDVEKKKCKCRMSFDMMDTYRCGNLKKRCEKNGRVQV